MKFLIDECLHTSLVGLAHESGFAASHVTFLGLAGARDRQIIATAIRDDYALVTNDRSDFLTLYRQRELHAGLIILVPTLLRRVSESCSRPSSPTSESASLLTQ